METLRTRDLAGWVRPGEVSRCVLLLHGGPGLSQDYLRPLVELLPGWTVASFQQRGLPPSTTRGPFDLPTAVADVQEILDLLGWEWPIVSGHSWGGLLAWHVAAALGDRLGGVLAIDSIGAVGDMALPEFVAELQRRLSTEGREAFAAWEAIAEERELDVSEELAVLELLWPSYFADQGVCSPFTTTTLCQPANAGLMASAVEHQADLISALPSVGIPIGALVGEKSPIPRRASTEVAALVPRAWVDVVPGAGHFPWFEQPACVAAGLDRLLS